MRLLQWVWEKQSGFATGDRITVGAGAYTDEWYITVTSATTFILQDSVFVGTATGTAFAQVQIVSPYNATYIRQLSFAQSADTLFITHRLYKPRKLTRSSATSWALSEFTTIDGPYLDYDKTNTRMTVSNITDVATLIGNAAFVAGSPFADPPDVGRYIEFMENNEWWLAKITAVNSTSNATVDIVDNVKVGIDPVVRLNAKRGDSTDRPAARSPINNARIGNPISSGMPWAHPFYRPTPNVVGVSPDTSPPTMRGDGVDPNAAVYFNAGLIVSSHSNTFELSDAGKYVRTTNIAFGAAASWYQINFPITSTAANETHFRPAATVLTTMKTYNYAGGEAVALSLNSRVITATLTASAATFAATDVGRHIRLSFQNRWVFAKISAYTSSTVVTVTFYDSFPRHVRNATRLANDGVTDIWRWGAWYGSDETGNYPSEVTFHEQRLWFAGSPAEPQTLWASRPQDFNKMSPSEADGTVLDDNAINVTLASNRVNAITWLRSAKVLLVGTIGGEWQGRAASSITEPMTPTNIAFTEETTHGSVSYNVPVKVGSAILFIQRNGHKVRELTYNWELDGWSSRDITIASEHILRKATRALKIVYQNEPRPTLWLTTVSGDLVGCTYQREQEVLGWHYHRIGGSGVVESLTTVPDSNGMDQLFMVVRRDARRYIEKLSEDDYPDSPSDKSGFFYVDGYKTESMAGSGSTWTVFQHMIGMTLTVLKNGVSQGAFVVNASGVITGLSYVNGDVLTGGLAYTSKFKSLPVQGGSPYGSSDMTMKRVARLFLRVYNSIGAKIGRSESALVPHTFDPTGLLFTGDYGRETNLDYSSDGVFHIQVSDPYPLILLSHVAQVVSNE